MATGPADAELARQTMFERGGARLDPGSLIESLTQRATDVLRPLLGDADRFALIGFPHYGNVGDSAIFLGQLACLRRLGRPAPRYVCDPRSYDREALRRHLRGGTILLAGGGGFGDLWPLSQQLREEIAVSFKHNRIVQLSQSIHFQNPTALDRARRAIESHPDFTLLAREDQSLDVARRHFAVPTGLCPDMAVFLGPLPRPSAAARPITWLARTDQEATPDEAPPEAAELATDWLAEPRSPVSRAADHLIGQVRRHPGSRVLRSCLSAVYAPLARERLRRGCAVLARGRVVITDRLHGHILSLLLGIPHVIHNNSYGKVSSFYRTWTSGSPLVRWADSRTEAYRLAVSFSREEHPAADDSDAVAARRGGVA